MSRMILQVIAGIAGLWLATKFIEGVTFAGQFPYLLLAGTVLGLINFFVKPVLKAITLPLRILTLGLFTLLINMAMVWIADVIFPELVIIGLIPLFWTSLIVWAVSFFLGFYAPKKKAKTRENVGE